MPVIRAVDIEGIVVFLILILRTDGLFLYSLTRQIFGLEGRIQTEIILAKVLLK